MEKINTDCKRRIWKLKAKILDMRRLRDIAPLNERLDTEDRQELEPIASMCRHLKTI